MRWLFAFLLVAPLLSGCQSSPASPPPSGPQQPAPAASAQPADLEFNELLEVFHDNCLTNFPDDEALARKAAADGDRPLTQQEVQNFLHGDPGRGWMATRKYGEYRISIELPPFHTCVVRKTFAVEPNFKLTLGLYLALWAASQKPGVNMAADTPRRIPGQGMVQDMYSYGISDLNKKPIESISAFIVHYSTISQIEIRLARSRGNNPR